MLQKEKLMKDEGDEVVISSISNQPYGNDDISISAKARMFQAIHYYIY